MARNAEHLLLTTPSPEIDARKRFVRALKREVEGARHRSRAIYDQRVKPQLESAPDGDRTRDDAVLGGLYADDLYQTICTLKRTGQELMWSVVEDAIRPENERISDYYRQLRGRNHKLGSLRLDANLQLPEGLRQVPVHLQPGGYLADEGEDDLFAGALYEEGGALYSQGQGIGQRESKAASIIRFIGEWQPDFRPTRILDVGCSAGASSTPYAEAFADAEVYAIDVAPAMLRYAHARAEALGLAVHFQQMDATQTRFADGSFDLVVSHNAMHEMSAATQQAMFRESFRLLADGGVCVHQDVPLRFSEYDAFEKAERLFDKWFNGELYWADYADNDCEAMFDAAGFAAESRYCGYLTQADGKTRWYVAAARKVATAHQ